MIKQAFGGRIWFTQLPNDLESLLLTEMLGSSFVIAAGRFYHLQGTMQIILIKRALLINYARSPLEQSAK